MAFCDQLYFMSGDIVLSLIQYEGAVFANKNLLGIYQIKEDLYSVAAEGKWTVDKLAELTSMVSDDLDGNGVMNEHDRFGLGTADSARILALGFGSGLKFMEMNDAGLPEFALNQEHTSCGGFFHPAAGGFCHNPFIVKGQNCISTKTKLTKVLFVLPGNISRVTAVYVKDMREAQAAWNTDGAVQWARADLGAE